MFVRDINGAPLFVMDGSVGRDTSGKPILARVGSEKRSRLLSAHAAAWMTGRALRTREDADGKVLMDLGQADVATAATQATFPIPMQDFVADVVSQVRIIPHDRGVWYLETVTDAIKVANPEASSGGAPNEINPSYTPTSFVTKGYALAAKIPRDTSANADWDLKLDATRLLCYALRLSREVRVANLLTTTGNWAAANQITPVAKWNGGATAAPLTDMFAALAASYLPANVIVLPERAAPFFYASQNTASAGANVMRDYVQSGGEMPRVLFARAKFSASNAPAYVWAPTLPTNVALIRAPDSIPTTVTFRWLGADGPDGEAQDGFLVREYYDERDRSDYVVVAHNDLEVMTGNQVGALIVGALQ